MGGQAREEEDGAKRRRVKAPTLAELATEDTELRRLGMTLCDRITMPKAGVTTDVTEKIHDPRRKSELVRLKFHEDLAHDLKTAHELVEVWRLPSALEEQSEIMKYTKQEYERLQNDVKLLALYLAGDKVQHVYDFFCCFGYHSHIFSITSRRHRDEVWMSLGGILICVTGPANPGHFNQLSIQVSGNQAYAIMCSRGR